ncbi:MAG: Omp28-related outer membrane protein [Chitinophagaceae bacterium]|nr:Omp28-related outer membrane protein [Chitinophagaceae bacterium]
MSGSATFYVNGTAISGKTFTTASAGTYSVKAVYSGKETNTIQVVFNPTAATVTSITLTPSKTNAYMGETVTFVVTGNNGANLTAQSALYVNGAPITGSSITPTTEGTFAVKAMYLGLESNTVQVVFTVPPITSITLSASQTSLNTGGTTTFTVMSNTGVNVTAQSTITVNGTAISGSSYSTNTAGIYNVKATYNTIESNIVQVTFVAPVTSITLAASQTNVNTGTPVTFTVTTNTGVNVTAQSLIFVDGVSITGGSFTPSASGTYNVYATYVYNGNTLISNTVIINAAAATIINFNKRVLVEDFTGTWCQYCPRVAYAIDQLLLQTNDAVVTAIHRGSDPYNFSGANVLESQIGLTGYPTAQLNRTSRWTYPEPNNVQQAVNLTTGTNPRLGLAMVSSATGNDVALTVKVKFGDDFSNLRLVVYAVEDGLVYNQTNSTIYYGGANPIVGFVHNNVLRAVLTSSILGESITGTTTSGNEYTKTFNYTVPASCQFSKMHFVAFVINSSNTTLNARDAKINESQGYEIE